MSNHGSHPPYPSVFELYRELSKALDTKQTQDGDPVSSRLDAAARNERLDWQLVPSLIEELFVTPLQRAPAMAKRNAHAMGEAGREAVDQLTHMYLGIVKAAPVDALTRDQTLPILAEHLFLPFSRRVIDALNAEWPGPEFDTLTDPSRGPVDAVLEWAEVELGLTEPIERCAYPDSLNPNKSQREKVTQQWRRLGRRPGRGSIGIFCRDIADSPIGRTASDVLPRLQLWLIVARAIMYFERTFGSLMQDVGQGYGSCRAALRDVQTDTPCEFEALKQRLEQANVSQAHALDDLPQAGNILLRRLSPKMPKRPGDEEHLWFAIAEFELQASELDTSGSTGYGIAAMKARYHACAGQYRTALDHYRQTVVHGAHCADGTLMRKLGEEGATLAAHIRDRSATKNLIDRLAGAGLMQPPAGSTRESAVTDSAMDRLQAGFAFKFPPQGLFLSVDANEWQKDNNFSGPIHRQGEPP